MGTAREIEVGGLCVASPPAAGDVVAQQAGPLVLGVADHDGVGVGLGIVGDEGHMGPAEHHGGAPPAEVLRQLVGPGGGAGDDGQADDVGVEVRIDVLDALVDADHLGVELTGHERGQRRQV